MMNLNGVHIIKLVKNYVFIFLIRKLSAYCRKSYLLITYDNKPKFGIRQNRSFTQEQTHISHHHHRLFLLTVKGAFDEVIYSGSERCRIVTSQTTKETYTKLFVIHFSIKTNFH